MKVKFKILRFFVTSFLIISSLLIIIKIGDLDIYATRFNNNSDSKIYSNDTVDNEFSENSILVILNEQATMSFKKYTKEDFQEIDCYDVVDLTQHMVELVKKQLRAEETNDWSDLQEHIDNAMLIDVSKFRRILCLKIKSLSHDNENIKEYGNIINITKTNKEKILREVKKLNIRDDLIYAGPNFIHQEQRVPNDTYYVNNTQWAIDHISLPEAWDITTGSSDVKVGVIDSGIDGYHEDLENRLNNSLHRDCRGGNTQVVTIPFDTHSHGTHVAGIIGAETNTTIPRGMAGAAWNSTLVSLLVQENNGWWFVANAIAAVSYAGSASIPILNYSGGVRDNNGNPNTHDPAFEQAISSYPGLFVASAGNAGSNNDVYPKYPANYSTTLDNVISVGAIDSLDRRANYSNYGATTVNIYAPGVDILSTIPGDSYYISGGTSMAAPYVSGVAALIRSIYPSINAVQLKNYIVNNADIITINTPVGTQSVKRLNAGEAVKNAAFITSNDNKTIVARSSVNFKDIIVPTHIKQTSITTIGINCFRNQTQLTKVTINTNITTIGSNAFENTNNVPIYLQGRTTAPSTFHKYWNISNNPVYLNGSRCWHSGSKTRISIDSTYHADLCNKCRTMINKTTHNKYISSSDCKERCSGCSYVGPTLHSFSYSPKPVQGPYDLLQHYSTCTRCGYETIDLCIAEYQGPGQDTYCAYCGRLIPQNKMPIQLESNNINNGINNLKEEHNCAECTNCNAIEKIKCTDKTLYKGELFILPKVYDIENLDKKEKKKWE